MTRDYAYFIENRLRERYRLEGVPAIIDFVERNERRAPATARSASPAADAPRPSPRARLTRRCDRADNG